MEKHIAVVHVGAPDEERNTRKFLTNLAFRNVRQINTAKFTCLLNNKTYEEEQVQKHEFLDAIDKYMKLDMEEQMSILNDCCEFIEVKDTVKTFRFELPQEKYPFENIENDIEIEKEIQELESRLKFCKNHLEKQQINRKLQNLKLFSSKKRGGKPRNKKKR